MHNPSCCQLLWKVSFPHLPTGFSVIYALLINTCPLFDVTGARGVSPEHLNSPVDGPRAEQTTLFQENKWHIDNSVYCRKRVQYAVLNCPAAAAIKLLQEPKWAGSGDSSLFLRASRTVAVYRKKKTHCEQKSSLPSACFVLCMDRLSWRFLPDFIHLPGTSGAQEF